jgi:ornithine carbamoyltransferase
VHPEELIARWKAWDERPGNQATAHALSDAAVAYAGDQSNNLYRHVAAARRAGMSIAAAIYTWEPPP